jgi:hypothetical protein
LPRGFTKPILDRYLIKLALIVVFVGTPSKDSVVFFASHFVLIKVKLILYLRNTEARQLTQAFRILLSTMSGAFSWSNSLK